MFLSYRMCGSDASYRRKWWKRYTNYGTIELVIALYGEKEVFYGSRNTCILQVDLPYALRLGNAFFADYRVVIGLDGLLYRHFARAVGSDQISAAHADNLILLMVLAVASWQVGATCQQLYEKEKNGQKG